MPKKLVLLILLSSFAAYAQVNISKVGFSAGLVGSYHYDFENTSGPALYLELKTGGIFFEEYFEWELHTGFWDDGINEPHPIADHITYSYSSLIVGTRIIYFPQKGLKKFPIPIHFIGGFSTRLIDKDYVGGFDLSGNEGNNKSFTLLTADFGVGINYELFNKLRLHSEFEFYLPINGNQSLKNNGANGLIKFGIDYLL